MSHVFATLLVWLPTGGPAPLRALHAARGPGVLAVASARRVALSRDRGETWRILPLARTNTDDPRVRGLTFCQDLFVATDKGLWRSDGLVLRPEGPASLRERPISSLCSRGRRLLAVQEDALWLSRNCGRTWRSIPSPAPIERCQLGPGGSIAVTTSGRLLLLRRSWRALPLPGRVLDFAFGPSQATITAATTKGAVVVGWRSGHPVATYPTVTAERATPGPDGKVWLSSPSLWRIGPEGPERIDLGLPSGPILVVRGGSRARVFVGLSSYELLRTTVPTLPNPRDTSICGPPPPQRPVRRGICRRARRAWLLPTLTISAEALVPTAISEQGRTRVRREMVLSLWLHWRPPAAEGQTCWLAEKLLRAEQRRLWAKRRAWRTCRLLALAAKHTKEPLMAARLSLAAREWANLARDPDTRR